MSDGADMFVLCRANQKVLPTTFPRAGNSSGNVGLLRKSPKGVK